MTFADTADRRLYARRIAALNALAGKHFNWGLQAYYFGLAVLTWFINPWLFVAATAWVTAILYRREFASNTLKALVPQATKTE